MIEPGDPTRTTTTAGDQDPPVQVPPFVCVQPCTNPPVSYGDCLDGCASGIHATAEDTKDLHVLYGRMAKVIMAKDAPPEQAQSPATDACPVCLAPIVPSGTWPVVYLEHCFHFFHYYCLGEWAHKPIDVSCPVCRTESCRVLFWPQVFSDAQAKDQVFQLQKRCLGLDVAPDTKLAVAICHAHHRGIVIRLNGKFFVVRRSPPPRAQVAPPGIASTPQVAPAPAAGQASPPPPPPPPPPPSPEQELAQLIAELHLADQARRFYLGDILPLEENAQYRAVHGAMPPLEESKRRDKLMLQFWCPFDRVNVPPGAECAQGKTCEFFHAWPKDTPVFIKERVIVRQFPSFFCLRGSRAKNKSALPCSELIQVHPMELVRCISNFHPTCDDVKDMDGFASKMARQIIAPVELPEPSQDLECAFYGKNAEPNACWIHLQNCAHTLHPDCLPLVRFTYRYPKNRLPIHCPRCEVLSKRTIVWPGPFRSNTLKKVLIERQLYQFKMMVPPESQVAIVQLPNQANQFTLDYGGRQVFTIEWDQFPTSPEAIVINVD